MTDDTKKEKQKKLLKKSLFSLNDTEESLTHLGQSLSELDSYDDFMVSAPLSLSWHGRSSQGKILIIGLILFSFVGSSAACG